jgi:hypothetical protein
MTPDEVSRIDTILCTAHSEIVQVAGMPVAEVSAWARSHHDCDLTVLFADKPNPLVVACQLYDRAEEF